MIKTLASQVKEYKKASIITPIFVTFEVLKLLKSKLVKDRQS